LRRTWSDGISSATQAGPIPLRAEEILQADEVQVTAVRDGGLIGASDPKVSNRFFHAWTFSDDKFVGLSHTDRGRGLEAAGLLE
jgi:hypothetical protein